MSRIEEIQSQLEAQRLGDGETIQKMLQKQEVDELNRQLSIIQEYESAKKQRGEFTNESLTQEIQRILRTNIELKEEEERAQYEEKLKKRLENKKYVKDFQNLFTHRISQMSLTDQLIDQQIATAQSNPKPKTQNELTQTQKSNLFGSILAASKLYANPASLKQDKGPRV